MNNENLEDILFGATAIGLLISASSQITREHIELMYYLGDWDGIATPTFVSLVPSFILCEYRKKKDKVSNFIGKYLPLGVAIAMSGLMLATEFGAKIHPLINNTPDYKDLPWLALGAATTIAYSYCRAKNLK
jgi:hypothetical protein